MSDAPTLSLAEAVAAAARLLGSDHGEARRLAQEVLRQQPSEPRARFVLGVATRLDGQAAAARAILQPLAAEQPGAPAVQLQLAHACVALGDRAGAIAALHRLTELQPEDPDAWLGLASQLSEDGRAGDADAAFARYLAVSARDPLLRRAAIALDEERLAEVERLLRTRLEARPNDVAALRMLGELATRLGRDAQAETLLRRCLALSPSFAGARHNLAVVLYRRQRAAAALAEVERLLTADPDDPSNQVLKAAILSLAGDFAGAIALYEGLVGQKARQPKVWLSYGHALRAAGRAEQAAEAYRRAIASGPPAGEAWWSLANLKTHPFSAGDEADLRGFMGGDRLDPDDRLHLAYALGKILEDRGRWAEAFEHYAAGAAIHRRLYPFDLAGMRAQTRGSKALFTPSFLGERNEGGADSPAPIFIVGLPRSGSTLVEQILASHSQVEGTFELPDIIAIARDLGGEGIDDPLEAVDRFLGRLESLDAHERRTLGERYLADTAIHRKYGRARFIDKMPNNSRYVGLIHLILPNAKIIDARRHPLAAGFSAFKQHFARGYRYTYDLGDVGRYYADYVDLMAHFDSVLPGRVHRVIYEDMVNDTEGEVRRLLDYLDLPFEDACLRFHETRRAVRTASSEQVRRPIYRESLDRWRHFEPWLGPLKAALGSAADDWRK